MNNYNKAVLKISKNEGDFNYWIKKAELNPYNSQNGIILRQFLKEKGFKNIPKGTKEVLKFIKTYCLIGDGGFKWK